MVWCGCGAIAVIFSIYLKPVLYSMPYGRLKQVLLYYFCSQITFTKWLHLTSNKNWQWHIWPSYETEQTYTILHALIYRDEWSIDVAQTQLSWKYEYEKIWMHPIMMNHLNFVFMKTNQMNSARCDEDFEQTWCNYTSYVLKDWTWV